MIRRCDYIRRKFDVVPTVGRNCGGYRLSDRSKVLIFVVQLDNRSPRQAVLYCVL